MLTFQNMEYFSTFGCIPKIQNEISSAIFINTVIQKFIHNLALHILFVKYEGAFTHKNKNKKVLYWSINRAMWKYLYGAYALLACTFFCSKIYCIPKLLTFSGIYTYTHVFTSLFFKRATHAKKLSFFFFFLIHFMFFSISYNVKRKT